MAQVNSTHTAAMIGPTLEELFRAEVGAATGVTDYDMNKLYSISKTCDTKLPDRATNLIRRRVHTRIDLGKFVSTAFYALSKSTTTYRYSCRSRTGGIGEGL